MCDANSYGRLSILSGDPTGFMDVDPPRPKKPKTMSEAEKRKRADERARLAASRAKGGYGHSDTVKTGPLGLPGPSAGKPKTLLGY